MLLTIKERSPLFPDKQETAMTTRTKLSALALAAATFTATALTAAEAHQTAAVGARITSSTHAVATVRVAPPSHLAVAKLVTPKAQPTFVRTAPLQLATGGPVPPKAKPADVTGAVEEALNGLGELASKVVDGVGDVINNAPGPACGWLICDDGSK
jgi:hypothetical protein